MDVLLWFVDVVIIYYEWIKMVKGFLDFEDFVVKIVMLFVKLDVV